MKIFFRIILVITFLISVIGASKLYAQSNNPKETVEEEIYEKVDVMPEYPGGEKAFQTHVYRNYRYPKSARDKNIQGTIAVRFVVEKDGTVSNPTVIKFLSHDCNVEAIRVINTLQKFTPGLLDGKPVRVYKEIPIRLSLQSN